MIRASFFVCKILFPKVRCTACDYVLKEVYFPMKISYRSTMNACFIGYVVQAIINNFVPLLFLTFQDQFTIPLSQITLLVTVNFTFQLVIDLICPAFIDKIGYKASVIIAHFFAAAGLIALPILPELFSNPLIGLLIAVGLYAVGGGLIEVLISPIVESCPTDNKEKAMSLLHSFYCWGHVGVVLVSTLFFAVFHIENWKFLAFLWALIPIANAFLFLKSPIAPLLQNGEEKLGITTLLKQKVFWLLVFLMVCAGACEQAVSQWASAFAEDGLKVSKTIGDLAGPMFFAIMMGGARIFYGKLGHKINLNRFMIFSGVLCVLAYLVISLSPWPVLGLLGCGLCGLSVGILWPGTISLAAVWMRGGGTALFALLALAGDLGCAAGPSFVGFASQLMAGNLQLGILWAVIFPIALLVGLFGSNKFALSVKK